MIFFWRPISECQNSTEGIPIKNVLFSLLFLPLTVSSQEFESVDVIGVRDKSFLAPGSTHILAKEQLKKFDYSDPMRLLQNVPGVYLQEEDGFGLRPNIGLRGATPHRSKKITILEDGIPIAPAPYSAPAAYFFPNTMKTESVEIFKGSPSLRYGPHSIGGAINFVTDKIPSKNQTQLGLTWGTIKKYRLTQGGQKKSYGYLLEYNRSESDGIKKLPHAGPTGFERDDFLIKARYKIRPYNQTVSFKTSYSRENSQETYLGLTPEDFSRSPYSRYEASSQDSMRWQHRQYQAEYQCSPRSQIKIRTTLYRHEFDRNWSKFNGFQGNSTEHVSDYLDPASPRFDPYFLRILQGKENSALDNREDEIIVGNNNRKYTSQGFFINGNLFFQHGDNVHHDLFLEFRYHRDGVKRLHTKDNFKMADGRMHHSGEGSKPTTQNQDTAYAQTFFVEDQITFFDNTIFLAGFRLENVKTYRESLNADVTVIQNQYRVFAPGIGIQYSPGKNTNIIAGVSKGISTVSPGQTIDIKPEESINYEAGVKHKGLFLGQIIGFYNNYKNIKGFCSLSSGCSEKEIDREFNGGKARVYGFESHLKKDFLVASLAFPMEISYTRTIAKFIGSHLSQNREWGLGLIHKNDPLPYIPQDKFSLSLGIKHKRLSSSLIYNRQGNIYDQSVREGRKTIPRYGVADWITKYRYSSGGEIFLKIDNLLNNNYIVSLRPFGARPGKPQSISLGFNHVF